MSPVPKSSDDIVAGSAVLIILVVLDGSRGERLLFLSAVIIMVIWDPQRGVSLT